MARNPNSLPDSKEDYVRGLVLVRSFANRLRSQLGGIAVVMYHSEVPFQRAYGYVRRLAQSGFFAQSAFIEGLPDSQLRHMFFAAGAEAHEIDQYLATLNPKRAHLMRS